MLEQENKKGELGQLGNKIILGLAQTYQKVLLTINQIRVTFNRHETIKESYAISKILGNEASCTAGVVKG